MDTTTPPELLAPDALAHELKIPERTLSQWRYLNRGPRYVRVGKYVRYDRRDVAAWLTAQTVEPGIPRGAA